MVNKLDSQTIVIEFNSQWVANTSDFPPLLSLANMFPDFFRMGIFIDRAHLKL